MNRDPCGVVWRESYFYFRCMSKLVESSINSHQCIIKLSTLLFGVAAIITVTGVCARIVCTQRQIANRKKFSNGVCFSCFLCFLTRPFALSIFFVVSESISMLCKAHSQTTCAQTAAETARKSTAEMYRRNCINNGRPSGTSKCISLTFSFAAHFSMFPFKVKHCLQVTFPFSLSEMSAYVLWGAILIVTNTYKSGGLLYRIAGLFPHSSFFPILHPRPRTHIHLHSHSLDSIAAAAVFFFAFLMQSFGN